MQKIIIDTNALMAIGEFKLDLFLEIERACDFNYKIIILQGTIDELKEIRAKQRGKFKRAAKLALSMLKAKGIKMVKSEGHVDNLLVDYSRKGDLVLTQDISLKKRLTKPYLIIRQKKKVIMMR